METIRISEVIQRLQQDLPAGISTLTSPEDPYILTSEEEEAALRHELEYEKKHVAWKMANAGAQEGTILHRLAEINWDERIDRQQVLQRANAAKVQRQWHDEQEKKRQEEAERQQRELADFWTATRMFHLMRHTAREAYGRQLLVNDETLPLIRTICFFLARDERFETELGYDRRKGLLLRGVSGLGKTFLAECVAANVLNPINILSMIEVTDGVKRDGEYQVTMNGARILYLDDVGTESTPVKHYGTDIHWFKDYLELYYSRKLAFDRLMISTNCNFQQLEEKYGFRVRSRIKDMFNIIDVKGKDLRG